MKLLAIIIYVFAIAGHSFGQLGIQECGDAKTKAWKAFIEMIMKKDTTGAQSALANMDKDWEKCLIGKSVKGLSLKTLTGQILNDKDFKGKIVVINFWFINCTPCLAEMPALNRLVKEFQDSSVIFFGITYDSKSKLESFLPKIKYDFLIVPDSKDLIDQFGVNGYPTTIIIDKNLTIRKLWLGGGANTEINTEAYNRAKPIIDELLKAH